MCWQQFPSQSLATGRSLLLAAALLAAAGPASAIPTQPTNPHTDEPAHISWPSPAPGNPETANHFHLRLRAGETLAVGASSLASNRNWAADSVWDDRTYRFADGNADQGNDLIANFGHGFIKSTASPRYFFNNVPAAAQPLLVETFSKWSAAAREAAASVGGVTPGGLPVATGIDFQPTADQANSEFQILFAANVLATQNAFAEWIASAAQDNAGAPVLVPLTMVYESNPTNTLFFDNDLVFGNPNTSTWELRLKDADAGTLGNQPGAWLTSFTQTVGWHFGAGAPIATASIDFEYRDSTAPGNIFDELPAGSGALATSTFHQFTDSGGAGDADVIDFTPMDFRTIALHETGHILGLLHDPSSAAGGINNIMRSQIAFNASFGQTLRAVDADSAFGAALLYSIPVPEPGTGLMLAWGVAVLARTAQGRRRRA